MTEPQVRDLLHDGLPTPPRDVSAPPLAGIRRRVRQRRIVVACAAAVVVLMAVPFALQLSRQPVVPVPPAHAPASLFEERAQQIIEAWRASGLNHAWNNLLVPLGSLETTGLSDGGQFWVDGDASSVAYKGKAALMDGHFRLEGELPPQGSTTTEISFPDGGKLTVPVMSASRTYAALDRGDGICPERGCTLTVTGAVQGTMEMRTSRGTVTLPAWHFTVSETTVPVIRVAVDPSAFVTMRDPLMPEAPEYLGIGSASVVPGDGTELRFGYEDLCRTGGTALIYETADVVVLAAVPAPVPSGPQDSICLPIGLPEAPTLTVRLAAPLGDRTVLDASRGMPLVVTR